MLREEARRAYGDFRKALILYGRNSSLRAWWQLASFVARKRGRVPPPAIVVLAVTDRCPCLCPYCYAAAARSAETDPMSTADWKKAIDGVKAIGALEVLFTGGEPLLRDDLPDLVAYAHARGLLARLSTNGWLLDRRRVLDLKRAGLNECGVSIDEPDAGSHDEKRGLPGLYARATEALRLLGQNGIRTRILAHAIHGKGPERLERIVALGRELRVDEIHINIPFAAGRLDGSFDQLLSDPEIEETRRILEPGFVYSEFPTPESPCCAFEKRFLFINARGEVTPCPVIPYAVGNLGEADLPLIWKRNVLVMRLRFKGRCPMNDREDREALRAHSESARSGRRGRR